MAVLLMVVLVFCPSLCPLFDLRLFAFVDHTAPPMVKITSSIFDMSAAGLLGLNLVLALIDLLDLLKVKRSENVRTERGPLRTK